MSIKKGAKMKKDSHKPVVKQVQEELPREDSNPEAMEVIQFPLSERLLFSSYPEYVNSVLFYAKEIYLGKNLSTGSAKELSESIKGVRDFLDLICEKVKKIKTV